MCNNYLSILICSLLLSCINSFLLDESTDKLALIALKNGITQDPLGILNSWNDSVHFCQWPGVVCGGQHLHRVTALNLQSNGFVGLLSPSVGNLTFLRQIMLHTNSFHGEIPDEIGRLSRLQVLNLSSNLFEGQIPSNLTHCSNLVYLDLIENKLQGRIPQEIDSLSKLNFLGFSKNNLTGIIPSSIGNLSFLTELSLSSNFFEGLIPESLGLIRNISFLQLSSNLLSGEIPPSIFNLSVLDYFSVTDNQLEGSLPLDFGYTVLPRIRMLLLAHNSFMGPIPISLSNATNLQYIALSYNNYSGSIPKDLGRLQNNLYHLDMSYNRLGTAGGNDLDFIDSLTNCTNLETMNFYSNVLTGSLNSIANLSNRITLLAFGENQIHGTIPLGIVNLVQLERLYMQLNYLAGSIPADIGNLYKLQLLTFDGNNFSGKIPSSLGNLTLLNYLSLESNNFVGEIPPELSNCNNLLAFSLSSNNLIGSIPKEIMGLSSLSVLFNLSYNSFTGSLPLEVGSLINVEVLDVSNNKLSGDIPSSLGVCVKLLFLGLNGNFFQGNIPESLSTLRGLEYIDVSYNNLSGKIPPFLGELTSLTALNLSFNALFGEVPTIGVFKNASIVSVLGNYNLCGGVPELNLPPCHNSSLKEENKKQLSIKVIIPMVAAILGAILVTSLLIIHCYRRKESSNLSATPSFNEQFLRISYSDLQKATGGFAESNIIGAGRYGTVYKGILPPSEMVVAVKVLNLQQRGASKSFVAECRALKKIRHRNLVKVLSACSSVDFQGNDFKALVFEFMPKGNLDRWLHPENEETLNLMQRLNIAIEVALAIEYLHCHCQTTIAHCDLKPSNVLLDEEMSARVGDFGLAKIISLVSTSSSTGTNHSTAAIKGSIGYIAPEYALSGNVSTEGDVYSFGILLLEMFTGRRPTNEMFKDGLTLHNVVKMVLPQRFAEIVDPILLLEGDERGENECCISILRIGITCSMESPRDRKEMGEVVKELCSIRNIYLRDMGLARDGEDVNILPVSSSNT